MLIIRYAIIFYIYIYIISQVRDRSENVTAVWRSEKPDRGLRTNAHRTIQDRTGARRYLLLEIPGNNISPLLSEERFSKWAGDFYR